MNRKWSNGPGTFSTNATKTENGWEDKDGKVLPLFLRKNVNEIEIVIDFESSGHHQDASMYGGADHLGWPADDEDERTLIKVEIDGKEVDKETAGKLFDYFLEKIDEADLDYQDRDEE